MAPSSPALVGLLALTALSCAKPTISPPAAAAPSGTITLVESFPRGTPLDHPDLDDTAPTWRALIDGARETLDIAEFYVSDADGSALHPIVLAIEAAARRGVRVRLLVEEIFFAKYPDTVTHLQGVPNVSVVRYKALSKGGGIHHAKYFVVDGARVFLGSQNFDWRSLEHIQELGVVVTSYAFAERVLAIFNLDFHMAEEGKTSCGPRAPVPLHPAPSDALLLAFRAQPVRVTPIASPEGCLPDGAPWDLPELVARIDAATRTVRVQMLTYAPKFRDGAPFTTLDEALRRAAARGVSVRLLVSHWGAKPEQRPALDALAQAGVDVRVITIPDAPEGPIPFARVSHAKYMAIDGKASWVGSSNGEGDYFEKSRNLGVLVEGEAFAARLEAYFDDGFNGPYASASSSRVISAGMPTRSGGPQ